MTGHMSESISAGAGTGATLPKNIVLCSDGTGNRGGQLNGTNVWRLYRAVDQGAPPQNERLQVAFHEDGVGTESFKLLRIIGGAFGWGITRNLEKLYAFLVQHYEPGDDIFLFGFSRGAYTVRLLASIVASCGIADRKNYSPSQIAWLAHEAVRAYKRETSGILGFFKRFDAQDFKQKYARRDASGSPEARIKCVGVWDTVDAVGLPFDELTAAFKWCFPLRFQDNTMSTAVENGIHALSLDDARRSFHPVLWDEPPADPRQTIVQTWFAGVHSNVGGGYSKDEMALVPLNWMLDHAERLGLRFHPSLRANFTRDADVEGYMYDSRSGLGAYYRYSPRRMSTAGHATTLTPGTRAAAANAQTQPGVVPSPHARVHCSVVERIGFDHDGYAPTAISHAYQVDGPCSVSETNPQARADHMEGARDLNLVRAGLYYVFLLGTLGSICSSWVLSFEPEQVDHGVLATTIGLSGNFVPGFLNPVIVGFQKFPLYFLFCAAAYGAVMLLNLLLRVASDDIASEAWHLGFGKPFPPPKPRYWLNRLARICRPLIAPAHWLRTNSSIRWIASAFGRNVMPPLVLVLILGWVLTFVAAQWRLCKVTTAEDQRKPPEQVVGSAELQSEFDTQKPYHAPGWKLVRGGRYCITVDARAETEDELRTRSDADAIRELKDGCPWHDKDLPATPAGLKPSWKWNPAMWMGIPFRRVWGAPWFQLRGEIGRRSGVQLPIADGGEFEAPETGELYLFVNDVPFLYGNNHGKATISIRRIDCHAEGESAISESEPEA